MADIKLSMIENNTDAEEREREREREREGGEKRMLAL